MKNRIILLVFILFFITSTIYAYDKESIKRGIKSRRPHIIKLKQSGVIGENYFGLLEMLLPEKAKKSLIDNENTDRLTIYKFIADKEKATVEEVGKRRALYIAQNAQAGDYLQNVSGEWYRKSSKFKPKNMPTHIYKNIKNKCTIEWQDDYRMQKYCIEKQVEAWQYLNN